MKGRRKQPREMEQVARSRKGKRETDEPRKKSRRSGIEKEGLEGKMTRRGKSEIEGQYMYS